MQKISKIFFLLNIFFYSEILTKTNSNLKKIRKTTKEDVFLGLKNFSETTGILDKSLRNIDWENLVDDALSYCISKVDAHSAYFRDYNKICESISGNFSGIGVSILNKKPDDEHLQIIDVIDNSPAQKIGMLPGDKVVKIEDENLKGLSSDEVISKIRGRTGSKLNLTILRGKNLLNFSVQRETISDRSSLGYYFPKQKIYFVSLKVFSENASKQIRNLIEKINNDETCKGLVLDLRSNPGGVMESAVEVASLFIPKNSLVVSTRNKNNEVTGKYFTNHPPVLKKNITIFILINNFTASAAEILASTLKFYSKKTSSSANQPLVYLLGTTTFGKGSVQEVIPLSNNKALKLTTMLYFLPNDKSIQEKGVKPDFTVMPTRKLSNEELFMNELFGKEKSIHHHISQQEVNSIIKKEPQEKNTSVDKKTSQNISKLEEAKNSQGGDEQDCEINDFGELIEKVNDKKTKNDSSKDFVNIEAKRKKHLADDLCVQLSVNMINFLEMLKKLEPTKNFSRQEGKKALLDNFLFSNNLPMEKLE